MRRARKLVARLAVQQAEKRCLQNDPNAWYNTMKPLKSGIDTSKGDVRLFSVVDPKGNKKERRLHAPITRVQADSIIVPSYTSYVGISRSILAESNNHLLIHPPAYDQLDEKRENRLNQDLKNIYRCNFDRRPLKLKHDHLWRQHAPHVERFFNALGINENDVLSWIFEKTFQTNEEQAELSRHLETSNLGTRPSTTYPRPTPQSLAKYVLPYLKQTTPTAMAYAALACAAFNQLSDKSHKFCIWEHVRRGTLMKEILSHPEESDSTSSGDDSHIEVSRPNDISPKKRSRITLCRVCHL